MAAGGDCGDLRCPEAAESVEPGWNQFLAPRDALDMFCAMLGGFAGNVALTYGARGGVYIAGGIAPRILDHLAVSEFRSRFVQKGRFQAYLEAIPSQVIVHPAATFLGLMSLSGTISP
jgi:glucokinase